MIKNNLQSLVLVLAFYASHCAKSGSSSNQPSVIYKLSRTATNVKTNFLYLDLNELEGVTVRISGDGFHASVNKDQRIAPPMSVTLTYDSPGTYHLHLQVFGKDSSLLIDKILSWEYSLTAPPKPSVTFDEDATNDQFVNLVVESDPEDKLDEIWVSGTVVATDFRWHKILGNNKVPIKVSASDGLKTIAVKTRNIFGTESEPIELQILKKSIGPTNCNITTNTLTTASGEVLVYMSATNDGDLYYQIKGDIAQTFSGWRSFASQKTVPVQIIDLDKPNKITVRVRDIASNFCPEESFTLEFNPDHSSYRIAIKDKLLWTDDENITVLPTLDALPTDNVSMYIHGNILTTAETFTWIPYQPEVNVTLTPFDGNRFVRVIFRVNGNEGAVQSVPIYLKPKLQIVPKGMSHELILSEIVGLESITIIGCAESYQQIAPTLSIPCSPNAAILTATYNLIDGTSVSRSVEAP